MSVQGLPEAFYLPVSDNEFDTTIATESPWDPAMQHGGPPAGLLGRAIERTRPDDSMQVTRISLEMLGPIPQGRMRIESDIVRPGKRVEMITARLFAEGRLAVSATAWRIRLDDDLTAHLTETTDVPPLPGPEADHVFGGLDPSWGYGRAIEWRFVEGGDWSGSAKVWTRPRIPLVAGEESSPLSRLLTVADSTNGVSARLPFNEWLSIPPTLNVTVQRPPTEWIYFDARTTFGPNGIGMARGQAYDEQGFCAEIAQPLLVSRR